MLREWPHDHSQNVSQWPASLGCSRTLCLTDAALFSCGPRRRLSTGVVARLQAQAREAGLAVPAAIQRLGSPRAAAACSLGLNAMRPPGDEDMRSAFKLGTRGSGIL